MRIFAGGADHVVHVDSVMEVTQIEVKVRASPMTARDVRIQYRISAEEISPIEGERTVRGDDIVQAIPY